MRKHGGWIIAAALSLGLAMPALAQTSGAAKLGKSGMPADLQPLPAAEGKRLMEIQMELAWLADPVTFPYYLEAHIQGDTLLVQGYVPSRAVHEQALKHARQQCSLKITDALKEHSGVAVKPTRTSASQLQQGATTALRQSVGQGAARLQVKCGSDSKITVSGWVGSFEEKLTVSQTLRRLHGCTAVINTTHVEVNGAPRTAGAAGAFASQEKQADTSAAEAKPASEKGTSAAAPKVPTLPASMNKTANAPTPPERTAVSAKPAVERAPVLPFGFFQAFRGNAPAKKTPPAASSKIQVETASTKPASVPVRSNDGAVTAEKPGDKTATSSGTSKDEVVVNDTPTSETPGTVKVLKEWLVPAGSTTAEELKLLNGTKPATDEPPSKSAVPSSQSKAPEPTESWAWWNERRPAEPPSVKEDAPVLNVPVVQPPEQPTGPKDDPPTIQPVKATVEPTASKETVASPTKEPKGQVATFRRGEPYMTHGTAILEEPGPRLVTPPHLLPLVRAACGSVARDVRVQVVSAGHVLVQVRPRSEADSHVLARRILALPALAAYEVEVHIELPQ
jgi:hypothetical protein